MLRRLGVVVLAGLVCAGAADAKSRHGRHHGKAMKAVQALAWAQAADKKCRRLDEKRHRKLIMIVTRAEHELGRKMSRAAAYAVVRKGAMLGGRVRCDGQTESAIEDTADEAEEAMDTVESDTGTDADGGTGSDTGDVVDTGDTGDDTADTGDDVVDTGDDTADTGDDVVDTGDDVVDTGDDVADTGDDTADTGDDTADTGDDTADTGDDTAGTGDDTAGTGDDTAESGDDSNAGGYTTRVRIYYLESRCRFLPRGRALGFWKAITNDHYRAVKRYGARKVTAAMTSAKARAKRMSCNARSRAAIIAVVKKMRVGG